MSCTTGDCQDVTTACASSASEPIGTSSAAALTCNLSAIDKVVNGSVAVTTRTGKQVLSLEQLSGLFGFGVAPFDFATGGTLQSVNQLVLNSDGFYYHYTGAASNIPLVIAAGFDPTASADWEAFTATVHNLLSGRGDAGAHDASSIDYGNRTVQIKLNDTKSPTDFGAIGDGVVNDEAAFIAFENEIKFSDVDLLGRTYKVTTQKTLNNYYNGKFFDAELKTINQLHNLVPKQQAQRTAETVLTHVWNDPRYRDDVPDGLQNAFVILGDSISHGAYQGNLYQDGWVNILKRMLRAQFGDIGYGHTPMLAWESHPTTTKEVHDVSFNVGNAWLALESSTGGADIMQGLAFQSSQANDIITFTVPTFRSILRMWYVQDPAGGVFSYSINGEAEVSVNTSGSRNVSKSTSVAMTDNGYGSCQIVIKVISGTVTFAGIGYETGAKLNVQNFSQSGRRLRYATEQMIDYVCRGSSLILALGHNDYADAASDQLYADEFNQRIDWIIKYCIKYNTNVYVADFCWWVDQENPVRVALRRCAIESNGTYIGLPDYLTRDDYVKAEYSAGFYQVDASYLFYDTSHPTAAGAKFIAETVGAAMGLSITSKSQALNYFDYAWPIQLKSDTDLKNRFNTIENISQITKTGSCINVALRIRYITSAGFPSGDFVVCDPQALFRQVFNKYISSTPSERGFPLHDNTNAIVQSFTVSQNLGIVLHSAKPYFNDVSQSIAMPSKA